MPAGRAQVRQGGGPRPLFDSEGKYVPYYHNANAPFGVFADVNGDGSLRASIGFVGFSQRLRSSTSYRSWRSDPLLCVAYNPEHRETATGRGRGRRPEDGVLQIQLGPWSNPRRPGP